MGTFSFGGLKTTWQQSATSYFLTLSRRVLPAADVASPSLAGHIFETILHPYTQHTLLDSLENLLLDGISHGHIGNILAKKIGNRFAIVHTASHVYLHIRSHKILDLWPKLLNICQLGKKITGIECRYFPASRGKANMIFVAKVVRRSANFLRARASVRMPSLRTSIFRKTAAATRGFCVLL